MKKISILVPCCNVEQYIRQCLDSIQKQTYTNIEVICINDGSTDSTGAIIDEYVAIDPRFKAIHKKNSGYGDSMNIGLDTCSGDYIGIVESDDWIEPNMYETLLSKAERYDLDLVRCLWKEGPTGTENTDEIKWIKKNQVVRPLDEPGIFCQAPAIWASLYRKDLLNEGRTVRFLPTPGASYQDTSFAFKVYTKSQKFMMLDVALHHYRVNPASSVSSKGKVFCINDEWEEIFRWICEDSNLRQKFSTLNVLAEVIYGGLIWNYNRLTPIRRLWFLRRASKFLKQVNEAGILCNSTFKSDIRYQELNQIICNPLSYHYTKMYNKINALFSNTEKLEEINAQDLVSVVVTCYNNSSYIQSCLLSIINQNYRNIEVICVDDCSTDESQILVRHMMRKDKRIKLICAKSNRGQSVSRNMALVNCSGKYVVFIDGDDYLLPGAISKMCMNMSNSDDVVIGTINVDYEGGEKLYGWLPKSDKKYYTINTNRKFNAIDHFSLASDLHVSVSAKLWRLDIINQYEVRFPEGLLFEDANFCWKYLSVAPNIHTIEDPILLYQRHISSSVMSNVLSKKQGLAIQHIYIIEDLFSFLKKHTSERVRRIILDNLYEPYFWFAYNNSSEEERDSVLSTMAKILNEQQADTSNSSLLNYIKTFNNITKSHLFMQAYSPNTSKKLTWRKYIPFLK